MAESTTLPINYEDEDDNYDEDENDEEVYERKAKPKKPDSYFEEEGVKVPKKAKKEDEELFLEKPAKKMLPPAQFPHFLQGPQVQKSESLDLPPEFLAYLAKKSK